MFTKNTQTEPEEGRTFQRKAITPTLWLGGEAFLEETRPAKGGSTRRAEILARMRMFQVDAFTSELFRGNPAAVLILEEPLSDETMQAIAAENNLSETAFAEPGDDGWHLRWFTPVNEAGFCGHATLATAHVLATEYDAGSEMLFQTQVGEIRVRQENDGYRLDLPAFEPESLAETPQELEGVFQTPPKALFRNFENVFAELASEQAVRQFVPDLEKIARLHPMGLVVTARGESFDFVSRYFAPGSGIPEDPVSGSTHATLVPYWSAAIGQLELTAYQASQRGGVLDCQLSGGRVLVVGKAVTFFEATLRLDR